MICTHHSTDHTCMGGTSVYLLKFYFMVCVDQPIYHKISEISIITVLFQ